VSPTSKRQLKSGAGVGNALGCGVVGTGVILGTADGTGVVGTAVGPGVVGCGEMLGTGEGLGELGIEVVGRVVGTGVGSTETDEQIESLYTPLPEPSGAPSMSATAQLISNGYIPAETMNV
jgi:hypothetical protein